MSHTEFKARALYDFVAEGSNELSFRAHEILTITSNAAGNGWWYAKNNTGKYGVVPENYVEALADPPEPNEPPPLPSYTPSNQMYPSFDSYNKNNNRTSYQADVDTHQYMNPATLGTWEAAPEPPSWPPVQRTTSNHSKRHDTDSDDSFSDSENTSPAPQILFTNTTVKQTTVKRTNTLPSNSTPGAHGRQSISGSETAKSQPRARFFDKHGLDSYLLNGSKAKPEKFVEITVDDYRGVSWAICPEHPPFTCKVEDTSKGSKLGGLKAFTEYKIQPNIAGSRVVGRRYKQFDWLHEQLGNKFRFICIPPLPGKQISGRFESDFVEERRRLLEIWLNRVCRHPILCASFPVQHFITCEMSDKDRKNWKKGKRQVEKDELREASWLQSVNLTKTALPDQQIQTQIDVFAAQQPALESHFKLLSQGVSKYLERCTDVYERDIQKISELFGKVHQAVLPDTTTAGNKALTNSISKISSSYTAVASLYKTDATTGLRKFNERLQEYIGLISCFPSILNIQKSASEFMKTIQNRNQPSNLEFSNAIHRNHVLNHVVLAEINFFQQEKVVDLSQYMETFVEEQIKFYRKVTEELTEASSSFK